MKRREFGRMRTGVLRLAAAAAVLFGLAPLASVAQTLPHYANDVHLGVASCAGSTCHGAVQPWRNSTVLQNEYVTWQRQDPHAKAYQTLLSDQSKRIARNLGLPNAHEAKICLDCHADNPAENLRSKTFQMSDGVGCEACHGGAVRWLGIHVSGAANRADNLAAGMYPTEDPVARAKLCLSCHFGNDRKFVTHRIMGAGHPRMAFELDTFTATQPAHFRNDDDYRKRKRISNGVKTWAIGQAIAIDNILEGLLDAKRNRDGIFPELVFFDCHACHHPMSNVRWEARSGTGLGPGLPRLNDANLVMLRVIATQIDASLGNRLRQETLALHGASTQGGEATVQAARTLKATTAMLITRFAGHEFGRNDMQSLLTGVIKEGLSGEYVDYAAAEQATMALSAIINAMKMGGMIDDKQFKSMSDTLEQAYKAVEKDEAYQPRQFVAALQALESQVPRF